MIVDEQNYTDSINKLKLFDTLVVDVETNGLDPFTTNQICGVGIGTVDRETYYFPFRHQQGGNLPLKYQLGVIEFLNSVKTLS